MMCWEKGEINPVKKWWWDLELDADGAYAPAKAPVNTRALQKDLDLRYEDQTLAVYPAPLAPHPYPYPFPMDRDAGIAAYRALISADDYKAHLAAGTVESVAHLYSAAVDSPVMQVEVTKAEVIATGITKYEFRAPDGGDLPPWQAGAHLDIVVAPEFLRQYSMSGDPADRSCYQIAVLREEEGRCGSKLMQRIFTVGRRVFISRPLNHFPLVAEASNSLLMGGGIGITPMIAMAHELHAQDRDFTLHYSGRSRATMGFLADIAPFAWASRVRLHISDEGSRADFAAILQDQPDGTHLYTCGAEHYMGAVMAAAAQAGMPEDALHLEHFSVPEMPDYENYDFILRLAKTGRDLLIPADRAATDVLAENGIHLDVKCADGLCGVCKCGLVAGDVEHRDFVLSSAQRETSVILCQSRAAKAGGVVEVDL